MALQLGEHLPKTTDATQGKKPVPELLESPPSAPQEWQRIREQFKRMVDTAKNMAIELAEVKKQLHRTTQKISEMCETRQLYQEKPPNIPEPKEPRTTTPRPSAPAPEEEMEKNGSRNSQPIRTAGRPRTESDPMEAATFKPSDMKSYLEIAKLKKPQLEAFPETIREKVTAGKAALDAFVRPQPQRQIRPEAVYFKNAQRRSLRKLREALRISLPGEAVLNLEFIGGSLLEVICHAPLVPKLISHLSYMSDGRMRLIAFDTLAKPTISRRQLANDKGLWARNTKNCL